MELREYVDARGRSPFGRWFARLDAAAAARVTTILTRFRLGNLSSAKPVGEGVHELRIDVGPGYRVYFANDGPQIVILLGGGTKRRQDEDIAAAKRSWADYRTRMRNAPDP